MDTRPSDPPQLREIPDNRASRRTAALDGERREQPVDAAAPADVEAARDPRAARFVAKTIYRELRQSGMGPEQVMAVAGELLSLVVDDVRARRGETPKT
jgi:hypothetical protein